jgi:hypothetical protein
MEHDETRIERQDTLMRILYTVIFFFIGRLVLAAIGLVVIFELIYTLVTMSAPNLRVREFGNRAVAYLYRIHRYLTHNEAELPFPFSDFPKELEPSRWPYDISEAADLETVSEG